MDTGNLDELNSWEDWGFCRWTGNWDSFHNLIQVRAVLSLMERLCQGEGKSTRPWKRVSLWYRLESGKAPNTRTDPLAQKLPPLNFAKKTAIGRRLVSRRKQHNLKPSYGDWILGLCQSWTQWCPKNIWSWSQMPTSSKDEIKFGGPGDCVLGWPQRIQLS